MASFLYFRNFSKNRVARNFSAGKVTTTLFLAGLASYLVVDSCDASTIDRSIDPALLRDVQHAFPKATQKELEDFVIPLREEFNEKYPNGMDFKAFLYETDITDRQLGGVIFRAIDLNRDGTINANEWVSYCATESSDDPQIHLDFQFRAYDANGDGYILFDELVAIIRLLTKHGDLDLTQIHPKTGFKWSHGISSPEELATLTLRQCDTNHDNKIDHDEFKCVSNHIMNYIKHQHAPIKQVVINDTSNDLGRYRNRAIHVARGVE